VGLAGLTPAPPSPVWVNGGRFQDAYFWCKVKVEGRWYTSPKVLLKVKGAVKRKPKAGRGTGPAEAYNASSPVARGPRQRRRDKAGE
jgi:hypothetical protein